MLRDAVLILALGPLVYYALILLVSSEYFRYHKRGAAGRPVFTPAASILKPVRGLDREAYENFASYCQLDYPEHEILFCVSGPDDAAVPVIQKIQSDFADRKIRLLMGAPVIGTNDKVNKLCRLANEAKYDLLVITDSDVRVEPDYLQKVAAPFADSRVGAVTVLFRSLANSGSGSALDAAGSGVEFAASALLSQKLEGIEFTLGATMATTKQRLREIGGFEALANHYVDDYELGRRIAQRGYRVELAKTIVSIVHPVETLFQYFRHELRWTIGLRNVRPGGHAALAFTFGLPWTILAAAIAPSYAFAVFYVLAYLGLRSAVYLTVGVWGLQDTAVRAKWWLVPLRDAVSFGVWVASFFSNRIEWRGIEFRVRNGRLIPLEGTQSGVTGELSSAETKREPAPSVTFEKIASNADDLGNNGTRHSPVAAGSSEHADHPSHR